MLLDPGHLSRRGEGLRRRVVVGLTDDGLERIGGHPDVIQAEETDDGPPIVDQRSTEIVSVGGRVEGDGPIHRRHPVWPE